MAASNTTETSHLNFPTQCAKDCSMLASVAGIVEGTGSRSNRRSQDNEFMTTVLQGLINLPGAHEGPQDGACRFAFLGRFIGMNPEQLEAEARVAFTDPRRIAEFHAIERIVPYKYGQAVEDGDGMAIRQGWASLVNIMDSPEHYLRSPQQALQIRVLPWADNQLPAC